MTELKTDMPSAAVSSTPGGFAPLEMKHFTLMGPGRKVYCAGALPAEDAPEEQKKMALLVVHGFGSSKEGPMAQKILSYALSRGCGAVAVDLPSHGPHMYENGELTLSNCKGNVMLLEEYIHRALPGAKICYFASSFGAFITLLRLLDIRKMADIVTPDPEPAMAFLRSAAVNMPQILKPYDNVLVRAKMKVSGSIKSIPAPDRVISVDLKQVDHEHQGLVRLDRPGRAAGVRLPRGELSGQKSGAPGKYKYHNGKNGCFRNRIRLLHSLFRKDGGGSRENGGKHGRYNPHI